MLKFISLILFVLIYYFSARILVDRIAFNSSPLQLIILILLLPTVLVIVKYIHDYLEKIENSYLPPHRRAIVFFAIVFIIIGTWTYQIWDSYQQKPLSEAMASNEDKINLLTIQIEDDKWSVDNPEHVSYIMTFLGEYEVKKLKMNEITGKHLISLYGSYKNKALSVDILENYARINEDYYQIINGPINPSEVESLLSR